MLPGAIGSGTDCMGLYELAKRTLQALMFCERPWNKHRLTVMQLVPPAGRVWNEWVFFDREKAGEHQNVIPTRNSA